MSPEFGSTNLITFFDTYNLPKKIQKTRALLLGPGILALRRSRVRRKEKLLKRSLTDKPGIPDFLTGQPMSPNIPSEAGLAQSEFFADLRKREKSDVSEFDHS